MEAVPIAAVPVAAVPIAAIPLLLLAARWLLGVDRGASVTTAVPLPARHWLPVRHMFVRCSCEKTWVRVRFLSLWRRRTRGWPAARLDITAESKGRRKQGTGGELPLLPCRWRAHEILGNSRHTDRHTDREIQIESYIQTDK